MALLLLQKSRNNISWNWCNMPQKNQTLRLSSNIYIMPFWSFHSLPTESHVTQRTFKSYDLQPTVFTGQSVFSIAELLDQRARQLVANEQTRAENAERDIIARFDAEVAAVNAEVARVRLLAESLGDAELAQLEDSILKVLTQPALQGLLSGDSLDDFKLNSIVKAIKDQPDVAHIERMSPINGVASVIRMGFTDGRSSVLSADIVNLPADEAAGTPERLRFDYKTNDFLGLPAVQKVLFNGRPL